MTIEKTRIFVTDRFKKFRDDRDWSQDQLASFLTLQTNRTITRAALQKWESGRGGVPPELALDLSKALNIPVNELVERRAA